MRFVAAVMLLSTFALPALGGYAARNSWIAIAGSTAGSTRFETTVYMTDVSRSPNEVTMSFFPSGAPNISRSVTLRLASGQSASVDIGPEFTGGSSGVGALRIRSTGLLLAAAHLHTVQAGQPRTADVGEVLNAIPAQFAIGTGDSTLVPVPATGRYRLYAVETSGYALYFSIGSGSAQRRLMIQPHEQMSWDLADVLPGVHSGALEVTGINGSGKIIVLGTAVAEVSRDFNAYEMLLPTKARHRLTWPEVTAYALIAVAIASTALYRMKRPHTG